MKQDKEDPAFRPLWKGTGGTTPEFYDSYCTQGLQDGGLAGCLRKGKPGLGTPAGQRRPGKLGRSSLDRPSNTLNEEGGRPFQPALPRGLDGTQHPQLNKLSGESMWLRLRGSLGSCSANIGMERCASGNQARLSLRDHW